jgi:hypothetical protein
MYIYRYIYSTPDYGSHCACVVFSKVQSIVDDVHAVYVPPCIGQCHCEPHVRARLSPMVCVRFTHVP